MIYDESVEVVESNPEGELPSRLGSFHGKSDRPPSARQFPEGMSDAEDLDVGQEVGSKENEKVTTGIAPRQTTSNGDLRRPTTAGRPGTAGIRSGTSRGGNRSVRPRPPSPERSPSDAAGPPSEEDDDEYDTANAAKVEGPLEQTTLSELAREFKNAEDDTSEGSSDFGESEYIIDPRNIRLMHDSGCLGRSLHAVPEEPEFFLPPYHNDPFFPDDDELTDIEAARKDFREVILEKKRGMVRREALYSRNPGVHRAGFRVYDPADYEGLKTTPEIKEIFEYITKYSASAVNTSVEVKLRPFIPEYTPSVGDIDAFIKVIHSDVKKDGLGIKVLDEPCAFQSDPSVLDLKLRALAKQNSAKSVLVKKVENVGKNAKIIENWIKDISDLHRSKPSPSVHYSKPMPDIDNLLQEWPREFEELLKSAALPSPNMDCDLKTYVDLICNLLDIPIYKSRVQSLHLLATLYLTSKSFNNFGTLGSGGDEMQPSSASIRGDGVDRLEL